MATWWYIECLAHATLSEDEVAQSTPCLDDIRAMMRGRAFLRPSSDPAVSGPRAAHNFLLDHPDCEVRLVDEYDSPDGVIYPPVTE